EADLRDKRLSEMDDAYRTAFASGILSGLLGVALAFVVGYLIRRTTMVRRREDWLQSGHVGLAAAMRGDQVTQELGDNVLAFLARYLGAVAGAIFVDEGAGYRRSSTYGVPPDARIPEAFGLREGL